MWRSESHRSDQIITASVDDVCYCFKHTHMMANYGLTQREKLPSCNEGVRCTQRRGQGSACTGLEVYSTVLRVYSAP